MALAAFGFFSPACCCGASPYPSGPPGHISGQIYFATGMKPSRLAVYAVQYITSYSVRYAMTEVDPPARTYDLSVPPGGYQVVARLDSDPLSAAGYLVCGTFNCEPVMTRAGPITCRGIDCQPYLSVVDVKPGQVVDHVNVGGWGSRYARNLLWSVDVAGTPLPEAPSIPTPKPLPVRFLPAASVGALPAQFEVRNVFDARIPLATLQLPADWHAIAEPAREVDNSNRQDFSNREVRSPLALPPDGIWLTVDFTDNVGCTWLASPYATAQAGFDGTTLYFEGPRSAVGAQPFSGYAVVALKRATPCLLLRFTASSSESLESSLPTVLAIVQQAI